MAQHDVVMNRALMRAVNLGHSIWIKRYDCFYLPIWVAETYDCDGRAEVAISGTHYNEEAVMTEVMELLQPYLVGVTIRKNEKDDSQIQITFCTEAA